MIIEAQRVQKNSSAHLTNNVLVCLDVSQHSAAVFKSPAADETPVFPALPNHVRREASFVQKQQPADFALKSHADARRMDPGLEVVDVTVRRRLNQLVNIVPGHNQPLPIQGVVANMNWLYGFHLFHRFLFKHLLKDRLLSVRNHRIATGICTGILAIVHKFSERFHFQFSHSARRDCDFARDFLGLYFRFVVLSGSVDSFLMRLELHISLENPVAVLALELGAVFLVALEVLRRLENSLAAAAEEVVVQASFAQGQGRLVRFRLFRMSGHHMAHQFRLVAELLVADPAGELLVRSDSRRSLSNNLSNSSRSVVQFWHVLHWIHLIICHYKLLSICIKGPVVKVGLVGIQGNVCNKSFKADGTGEDVGASDIEVFSSVVLDVRHPAELLVAEFARVLAFLEVPDQVFVQVALAAEHELANATLKVVRTGRLREFGREVGERLDDDLLEEFAVQEVLIHRDPHLMNGLVVELDAEVLLSWSGVFFRGHSLQHLPQFLDSVQMTNVHKQKRRSTEPLRTNVAPQTVLHSFIVLLLVGLQVLSQFEFSFTDIAFKVPFVLVLPFVVLQTNFISKTQLATGAPQGLFGSLCNFRSGHSIYNRRN